MSRNKIVSVLFIVCSIVLFVISGRKEYIRNETMVEENLRTVVIENVLCLASKKSTIYFYDNNKIHRAFVASGKCNRLNSGDEIEVYYNSDNGWYFYKDDGLRNENNTIAIASIVIFFIATGYLVYSWRRKKV